MSFRSAKALYSYNLRLPNCVAVVAGDALRVWTSHSSPQWAYVEVIDTGKLGYLPPSHVLYDDEVLVSEGPDGDTSDGIDYWQDGEFFDSYSALGMDMIENMLTDAPRTDAYRRAFETQKAQVAGKIVMDVGCGTGILSMLAARAGAKKVYAIEASTLATEAQAVFKCNGFQDTITTMRGRVEGIPLNDKVDVIVSEWMGTFLIFENMIESVLIARDRFLKPGGWMMPSHANLFLAPASANKTYQQRIGFWQEQYGFDMTPLRDLAATACISKPLFDHIASPDDLLAQAVCMREFDMLTTTVESLKLYSFDFNFPITKQGTFHGFVSWFDVEFRLPEALSSTTSNEHVVLSTGPGAPLTHWKQDLLMWHESFPVNPGDYMRGSIIVRKNPLWHRHFVISVDVTHTTPGDQPSYHSNQMFLLWR